MVNSYQDLEVWERGMTLAEQVYLLTRTFPKEELFGLTSQLRRSASSIPANIAEGWGRDSTKEFLRFLSIAMGSLRETETHLILAQRVGLATAEQIQPLQQNTEILGRQLLNLQRSLRRKLENEK